MLVEDMGETSHIKRIKGNLGYNLHLSLGKLTDHRLRYTMEIKRTAYGQCDIGLEGNYKCKISRRSLQYSDISIEVMN